MILLSIVFKIEFKISITFYIVSFKSVPALKYTLSIYK
jgi:hypothetical protein